MTALILLTVAIGGVALGTVMVGALRLVFGGPL
jgi:hypothetical protein